MNTDNLYKQLRNMPVFRSKKYIKRQHEKFGRWLHHSTGSQGRQKLNDYLTLPLDSQEQHNEAEANKKDFCIKNLVKVLTILFEYIQELENSNK